MGIEELLCVKNTSSVGFVATFPPLEKAITEVHFVQIDELLISFGTFSTR